jgi:Tol biopolymer transport system component
VTSPQKLTYKILIVSLCLVGLLMGCSSLATFAPMPPITPTAHAPQVSNGLIAFTASQPDYTTDIFTMNSDGSNVKRLTDNPGYDYQPMWSPDGKKIFYISDKTRACLDVMNFDGSDKQCIPFETEELSVEMPESFIWSPDGTKIAFDDNAGSIFVMNTDGSDLHRVTPEQVPIFAKWPAWSPDSTWIAFGDDDWSYEGGDIYVIKADGTGLKQLNKDKGADQEPHWTPDGKHIIFSSREDGPFGFHTRLYIMDLKGHIQPLLKNQSPSNERCWGISPDEQYILAIVVQDGISDVNILDADDFSVKHTYQRHLLGEMIWSPDSKQILYKANHYHIMNVDGTQDREIVLPFDTVWGASWQPVWK